ncbi:MAG: tRNA (adenosine(37)-N6)-dimethylallyltransferase MiaA [Thermodesulfovibrionia bacterium]|nr:tRNA (adenosine(37)-N6)-dimethylallyltransferase MiaA [Thermodesulfovibrionia bacterium]
MNSSESRDKRPYQHTNTVVILLGPTGVGKTGFSLLLAKALNTEIISADSMQIYQHMDIGTAKPSRRELKEVRHHLINLLLPHESFSAGMFKKTAVEVIDRLHREGKTPLVVGGTGLYIKTLTRGLFEGPEADWSFREGLMEKEKERGKGYLYQYLKTVDPIAAKKINPNDTRRIIRSLEVSIKGRKTISELQDISTKPQDYHFVKIGLSRERKELYALIERRVDTLMEKGLVKETEKLLQMNPQKTSLQALGYKEMKLYLDGMINIEAAVKLLKKRTKMYAKRQFTWFRKEPGITWVDITGIMNAEEIFSKVVNNVEILKQLLYVKRKSKNCC